MENHGSPRMLLVLSGGGHPRELVMHTRRGSLPLRMSVFRRLSAFARICYVGVFLCLRMSVCRRLSASTRVCI